MKRYRQQLNPLISFSHSTTKGLTNLNNVLVTQRDLLAQQDQLLTSKAQTVVNLISLYKALGRGWDLKEHIDFSSKQ